MAPPKQKAASYELIETGGGEGYGSVEPASADSANEEYDKYDGGETPRRKLLSLVAPASATGKFLFVLCIVLVVASRLCTLAAPLALSQAIDGLEVASPEVVTLILVYVALRFASDLLSNAKTAFWSRVTGEISTSVATEVFAHIHRQSLGWHLGRKTGASAAVTPPSRKNRKVSTRGSGRLRAAPRRRDISRRRSAGATSTRPARLVARFRGNDRSSAPSPCRRLGPPSRTTTT